MDTVRGMMIAGAESLLLSALAQYAGKKAIPYTLALIPQDAPAEKFRRERSGESAGEGCLLDWNARNALSARTVLAAALNRQQTLDCAALVCTPPQRFRPADPDVAEIDEVIDKHVKSYLFLTRVLRAHFKRQGGGTLAFVSGGGGAFSGALDKTVMAAFTAFADALLAERADGGAERGGIRFIGFSAKDALAGADQAEETAARILKTLAEARQTDFGKWHKCGREARFPLFTHTSPRAF